jgi:hypothetical protein
LIPLPRPDKISTKSSKRREQFNLPLVDENAAGVILMCLVRTLTYISDITGFDRGDYFDDPAQVRAYFKIEVMERLYPGWSKKTGLTQADLDEMAGAVILHKWHCVF